MASEVRTEGNTVSNKPCRHYKLCDTETTQRNLKSFLVLEFAVPQTLGDCCYKIELRSGLGPRHFIEISNCTGIFDVRS